MAKTSWFVRKQPVLHELQGNYIDNKIDDLNMPFLPTDVILKLFVTGTKIVPFA